MFASLFDSQLTDDPVAFAPPKWINILAVISISLTIILAIFIYFGSVLALLIVVAAILAFIGWLKLGYANPISRRILPLFIVTIIANLIQGAEQHYGQYASLTKAMFPDLLSTSSALSEFHFATVISLVSVSLYLLAAVIIFYQKSIGGFVAWWLFLWSIVFPLSHFILPWFAVGGTPYLPGAFTAPLLFILGVFGVYSLKSPEGAKTQSAKGEAL